MGSVFQFADKGLTGHIRMVSADIEVDIPTKKQSVDSGRDQVGQEAEDPEGQQAEEDPDERAHEVAPPRRQTQPVGVRRRRVG